MSERTDKEVLDEWIDEHIKATALAMEVVEEACYREVSVPHLVGHITSIYADQMPQFIDYVASGRAEERRLAQVARLSDENYQLSEENNQLRELVRGAVHCKGGWCGDCPIFDGNECRKKKLMSGLEIEVDR